MDTRQAECTTTPPAPAQDFAQSWAAPGGKAPLKHPTPSTAALVLGAWGHGPAAPGLGGPAQSVSYEGLEMTHLWEGTWETALSHTAGREPLTCPLTSRPGVEGPQDLSRGTGFLQWAAPKPMRPGCSYPEACDPSGRCSSWATRSPRCRLTQSISLGMGALGPGSEVAPARDPGPAPLPRK